VNDKANDEALRDWESEGGAVPASSLPTRWADFHQKLFAKGTEQLKIQ
jgi:hypothetical protein